MNNVYLRIKPNKYLDLDINGEKIDFETNKETNFGTITLRKSGIAILSLKNEKDILSAKKHFEEFYKANIGNIGKETFFVNSLTPTLDYENLKHESKQEMKIINRREGMVFFEIGD